jgi:hypothetical protein
VKDVRRYWLPVAVLVVALAVAAALTVLAAAVWRSEARLRAGDVRFAIAQTDEDPWRISGSLPSRAARRLLGVDDDVDFRNAVQLFRYTEGQRGGGTSSRGSPDALRVEAAVALERFERAGADPRRASRVANLLGVMAFASAADEPQNEGLLIARTLYQFRRAIKLDRANVEAKYNLELLMRLLEIEEDEIAGVPSERSRFGERRGGQRGAGVSPEGHGY